MTTDSSNKMYVIFWACRQSQNACNWHDFLQVVTVACSMHVIAIVSQAAGSCQPAPLMLLQTTNPKELHAFDAALKLCMHSMLHQGLHVGCYCSKVCMQSMLPKGMHAADAANRLHGVHAAQRLCMQSTLPEGLHAGRHCSEVCMQLMLLRDRMRSTLHQGMHAVYYCSMVCMQSMLPKGMHAADAANRLQGVHAA